MPHQKDYEYHFLFVPPEVPGAWFTQAAQQYWLRFEPIVTHDWELISRTPADASVAVTVLARPADTTSLRAQAAEHRNDIHFDYVIADSLTEMEVVLNKRARLGLLFGN